MTKKSIDMVPFEEIQPFLNLLTNSGLAESAIMRKIGYSDGALADMRGQGKARLSIQYALKGLCAERKGEIDEILRRDQFALGYDEAELLFDVLISARAARPGQDAALRRIQSRVAGEMARQAR